MLKTLLEKQQKSLHHFFSLLDISAMERIFEKLRACTGMIVLSGVGKSGHIAQKISTTLVSTGTRATFLCPAHALHGDLGFITPQDIFFLFSKSGESQELFDLLPYVKKKGAFTIAAVSRIPSRLAEKVDLSICLPVNQELCPFDLAPTTSTAVQLLFGDCLAIALMKEKQFTLQDFASNHPAGFLGKKITLKVADLMMQKPFLPFCRSEERLIDMLPLLSEKRCGCLLICDEEKRLLGIFTDGDLRRAIASEGAEVLQKRMGDVMNREPMTISPHFLALDAMRQMEANPSRLVNVLPVVERGEVVGILRMHDVVQAGLR